MDYINPMNKTVLVTGSSGLVGSECVRYFASKGWQVHGIDNNLRQQFFGKDGDTTPNRERLKSLPVESYDYDIREPLSVRLVVESVRPDLVLHCAAQPSHDFATANPRLDFEVNALGTLNVLEATREYAPDAVFCFCSTNKVYGDAPNRRLLKELPTRYDFDDSHGILPEIPEDMNGFDERWDIDQSRHSLFGASKVAADIMVQEYGHTYGMKTGCFRCGCLTGSAHAGTEQHGFLAYLAKCVKEGRPYRVYGYKGKQVRDQLHAADVASAFEAFAENPRPGEVYNLGGGRENSISVLEAIDALERATGKRLEWEYVEQARGGDHIVYISDCTKFRTHYPSWKVTRSLQDIIAELAAPR